MTETSILAAFAAADRVLASDPRTASVLVEVAPGTGLLVSRTETAKVVAL